MKLRLHERTDPTTCDLMLTGGTVVTVDSERTVIDGGFVAITGDRIVGVGSHEESASFVAERQILCRGRIVMPGLIDCHNHLFQSLGRTIGEGLTGWEWLSTFMWPYAAQITREETMAAAFLGSVEAVLSGTTSVLDHHYGRTDMETTLSVADAVESVGLRGKVARGIAGLYTDLARHQGLPEWAFSTNAEEELAVTEACIRARPKGSKVEVWPGPINVVYTDQELLVASVDLARAHGVKWHTHCSAPQSDPIIYQEAYGVRPATWLARHGLLGSDTVLAHCTWLDDAEIEAIGSTHTGVAHCPSSNQYVPFGVMPLDELRRSGAVVGLGSDGSAAGHRQDLFENMKQLVYMHRLHSLDPQASSATDSLDIATRGGAAVLGVDAGTLEPGALADVIVVDVTSPHLAPLHNPVPGIVYAARGSDVDINIIGGEIIVENGRCTRIDQDDVVAEARGWAQGVLNRIGTQQPPVPVPDVPSD